MSVNQFTGVWFCRGKHILCICYSLYVVCRLIERDVACTSETLLYAVASLRPKSHACRETGFSGAQTAYIGHKNEWDFRPPVCTYRLNWVGITSCEWRDEWDDTALQTQDSQFEPWLSDAVHGTYGSRRLTTIPSSTSGWGRKFFVFFKPPRQGNEPGNEPGIGVKGSGANRYPRAPAHLYHLIRNITENRVIRHRTNSLDIWQRSRPKRLFPGKLA